MPNSSAVAENIRSATREDIPRVWELILELAAYERLLDAVSGNPIDLERHIFDNRFIEVFVVEDGGIVVGYSISYTSYSTFRGKPGIWLEDLYVTGPFRGRGYGKALLQNLIDICAERGCARLEWSVLDWNEPSISFYKSMGASILTDWQVCRLSF